ncbi:MAG: tetratricopeptide repeat protein [Kiloniellales bacterium]|nr:tetratricopeptide repeat protein [Kiloniellales bacterium]
MDIDSLLHVADWGDPYAQVLAGYLAENGFGMQKGPKLAEGWYRRAAEQGFAQGQFALACLLEESDPDQGVYWLTEAANAEYPAAEQALARRYWQGRPPTVPEPGLAFKWMKSAADRLFVPALLDLSKMYDLGVGTTADREQADLCLLKAAKAGSPVAASKLGKRLLERGGEENVEGGLHWVKWAASNRDPAAFECLADIYQHGRFGMRKDPHIAEVFAGLAKNLPNLHRLNQRAED